MKVLVTAKALDLDRTSEGICTTKFLYCLVQAGMEVACLAPPAMLAPDVLRCHGQWLNQVKLIPVEPWFPNRDTVPPPVTRALDPGKRISAWVKNKADALIAYGTGFSALSWAEVRLWRKALRAALASQRPDILFVRGAGQGFEPHLAMAGLGAATPWIANYHDPFPISLYPAPYRRHFFVMSRMQEKWNARIMRTADRVSFPSERLLRWMLSGKLGSLRRKGVVIPHIAGEVPLAAQEPNGAKVELDPARFLLIHAGTLLEPREPWGLFEAFRRFVAKEPARAASAELLLVGTVSRRHKADPRWREITQSQGIRVVEDRISYPRAMRLLRRASVVVVLEADAGGSPFFPAKLTDYLLSRKPILALSPLNSVVSDILGTGYPYRATHSDTARIEEILEGFWASWRRGDLAQAGALDALADRFSMGRVGESCKGLFAECAACAGNG
jgi:hypothetical protein